MRLRKIRQTPSRSIDFLSQTSDIRDIEVEDEALVQVAALGERILAVLGDDVRHGPFLSLAETCDGAAGAMLLGR